MKIKSLAVHNFRSIKDTTVNLNDYTCFVGANNSGKTNLMNAIRVFYEDIKFNESTDFPKFNTDDQESWIEIEYQLSDDEFNNLRDEYKNENKTLKVRKYLKSDQKDKVKTNQSNIYAYENGVLSNNLFYGAKNVSEGKLGKLIYIPELATTDDTLKLSGPSPLRDLITFIMNKVVKTSSSFDNLNKAFDNFNKEFQDEASKDGFSLNLLRKDINENLKEWGIEFNLNIKSIKPEDIIKNLVAHSALDKNLNKDIDIKYFGQGLQRHLIYTLLKLSTKYNDKKVYEKKEFAPDFTLILFEEPEAFLHPNQQELLNYSLRKLAKEENQQIVVTTHSPIFVSKNIEEITSIVRFKKENATTVTYQILNEIKDKIIKQNNELITDFEEKLKDPNIDSSTKNRIRKIIGATDTIKQLEEESIRYLLWLDVRDVLHFLLILF